MPRYQITSPDGRTVTIEGPRPPTQEDAAKIFSDLPPPRRQLATSQLDRDRELLRSEAGRKQLEERAAAGEPRARGSLGLLADIGIEAAGPAAGQALGTLTGPLSPVAVPVLGAVGGVGGNLLAQQRRISSGEQEGFLPGQAIASAVTGAIPGAPLAASGTRALVREGAKQAAGGLAARTIETGIDEERLPSIEEVAMIAAPTAAGGAIGQRIQAANPEIQAAVAEATARNANKRATLEAGRAEGLILPPSTVNPSYLNRRMEGIAGKEAVSQGAALKNAPKVTEIARREIGLGPGQEITETELRSVRQEAAKPYDEIETMASKAKSELDSLTTKAKEAKETARRSSTDAHDEAIAVGALPDESERIAALTTLAAADVQALKQARKNASDAFRKNRASPKGDPAALEVAEAELAKAADLESKIEVAAEQFGTPDLLTRLREGRTRIAKSWDIERALNVGDYSVSSPVLGRALDRNAPLTGGLETVARFQQAFPKSMRETSGIPTPGVSKVQAGLMLLSGMGGMSATGSPAGLLAGLIPLTSDAARAAVLSEPYQRFATRIPLSIDAAPDRRAILARTLIQEGAQELADEVEPKKKK